MSISIQQVSYIHPDKESLFTNISFSLNKGGKIALVGNNGSGKSTLLRIIAGQLPASAGQVVYGSSQPYYVPQHFGQYNNLTIAAAMNIDQKLEALRAILNGEVDERHFTTLNEDWNIEEDALASLAFWGLEAFELSHPMATLSGGEKTKVFLAGMQLHAQSVILMDEPTNHLDYTYRKKLYDFIQNSRNEMIIVSHDRTLLNLLPATYELSKAGIKVYGGNYEFYKEQKQQEEQALQQKLEEKEKQLRLARKTARETAERQQKHSVRGEKRNEKKGVSRIAMGNLKASSENTAARLKDIHAGKTEGIQQEVRDIRTAAQPISSLQTDFNSSTLHKGKILVEAAGLNFGYNGKLLWQHPLDFELRSGERICIGGNNGSGKTTLLKLITGQLSPVSGTVKRADGFNYVYMDQEYSMIDPRLSIIEQAETYNTTPLPEHEVRIILNRFLFPADTLNKPCNKLSGGEKMRLAFCCLMISNNTPDLFILDEPTNNLDIQSIDTITDTIKRYTGTVIAISHDKYFLQEIGVERSLVLG